MFESGSYTHTPGCEQQNSTSNLVDVHGEKNGISKVKQTVSNLRWIRFTITDLMRGRHICSLYMLGVLLDL